VKLIIRVGTIAFAIFAIAACASTPSAAPEQSASAETTTKPETIDTLLADMYAEEKVVCRREKTIGSRLGKRVCRTKSQRDAERIAGQQALERNAIMRDQETKIGPNE
jgi:hypothetical protein